MRASRSRAVAFGLALIATACTTAATPASAAPAACNGIPSLTDASGDGHHANTDILSAWFSEERGLQAVIQLASGLFSPAHDDSEAAGFALLFSVDGARRYVRAEALRSGAMRYDQGTWTTPGTFVPSGPTTGSIEPGRGGAVVIDVPGVRAGQRITGVFALTYDGEDAPGAPHWVDRGPGATTPAATEFGADLVVGACALGAAAPATAPVSGGPGGGVATSSVPSALQAVTVQAPERLTGGGVVTVSGAVVPTRAGVVVTVRTTAVGGTRTRAARTGADGRYALRAPITETTQVRASAEGLQSQTRTVAVRSTVRIAIRRTRSGGAVVTGRVRPALPGRVLWLRDGEATPTATTTATRGRFGLRLARPTSGRYQAVFIPSRGRAERSTSPTGVIR